MSMPYATPSGKAGKTESGRASLGGAACQCGFDTDGFEFQAITCQFSGITNLTDPLACFNGPIAPRCHRSDIQAVYSGTYVVPFRYQFDSHLGVGVKICRYLAGGFLGFPCGPSIPAGLPNETACFAALCDMGSDFIQIDVHKDPAVAYLTVLVYAFVPVLVNGVAHPFPWFDYPSGQQFYSPCFASQFQCSYDYNAPRLAFRGTFQTFPDDAADERTVMNTLASGGGLQACNSNSSPYTWNHVAAGGQVILTPGP